MDRILFALLALPSPGLAQCELLSRSASDVSVQAYFGGSAAAAGGRAVFGAPGSSGLTATHQGTAYVFAETPGGLVETARLTASDGFARDLFGASVAIGRDTIVVGAELANGVVPGTGAAYVFERSGDAWVESAKLVASDGELHDQFGVSIALWGDTLLVGAVGWGSTGAAYVFERDAGGSWREAERLAGTSGGDVFGFSVALHGDTALIGARAEDTAGQDAGAAYVFRRTGSGWREEQVLRSDDIGPFDLFGNHVALGADLAVVTSFFFHDHGFLGGTWVFERSAGGWSEVQLLVPPAEASGELFGVSATVDGDRVVVGSPPDPFALPGGAGAVHVYVRDGTLWSLTARLEPVEASPGDGFGSSVAACGTRVWGGAPYSTEEGKLAAGSIRLFELEGGHTADVCAGVPGSTGLHARLTVSGSLAIAAADTRLLVTDAPPDVPGVFLLGRGAEPGRVGDGALCIDPSGTGLFRLGVVSTDAAGSAALPLDFAALPPEAKIQAGTTWSFQFLFRDATGASALGSSQGVRATFCP